MQVTLLKSKIHRAVITGGSLDYEGSISLPTDLVELAGMHEYEKVLVANVANGNRFETYVILGKEREVVLNGAAAHLGKAGDKVIIMSWTTLDENAAKNHKPMVVHVDETNRPKHR